MNALIMVYVKMDCAYVIKDLKGNIVRRRVVLMIAMDMEDA
jgi:hypothetical protein